MHGQQIAPSGDLHLTQAEIVRDIKRNIASLKTSIERIQKDITGIRDSRLEIVDRFHWLRKDTVVHEAKMQDTIIKAKRIIQKSEANKQNLEIVLKKMKEFNLKNVSVGADFINGNAVNGYDENKNNRCTKNTSNLNSNQERIRLHLLDNNKYLLTSVDPTSDNLDNLRREKLDFKWGTDSTLRELQWILKMKLYKLRHHYDRLPYDKEPGERMPLSCVRAQQHLVTFTE